MSPNSATRSLVLAFFALALLATPALAQNMVVRIDGTVVNDGHKFTFPNTNVGSKSRVVVVLRNESAQDLLFTGLIPVAFAANSSSDFSVVQPALEPGDKLSPNGSTAFAVDYEPTVAGTSAEGSILIFTNAPGSPFVMDLSGFSPAPDMVVRIDGQEIANGSTLTFSSLEVGQTEQIVVVLRNQGPVDLVFDDTPPVQLLGTDAAQFSLVQPALETGNKLSPNASTAFAIRYEPSEAPSTQHVAEVQIHTNDPGAAFVLEIGSRIVGLEQASWGAVKRRF